MMKERRDGVVINAMEEREKGRTVGRSGAALTRVRLQHYQSAPKLHPEEQQITQDDKREGEWKQRGGRRR